MNRQMISDLLAAHADALNRSKDVDSFDSHAWLSARYPSSEGQILRLLQLAQALKQALVPVTTPRQFKAELGQALAQPSKLALIEEKRPVRWIILVSAAVIGLLLFVLSRLLPGQDQNRSQPMTTAA